MFTIKRLGSHFHSHSFWRTCRLPTLNLRRQYADRMDDDGDIVPMGLKTKMDVLNDTEDLVIFNGYGSYGFLLNNGFRLPGPIIAFPKTVLQWNVLNAASITADSLTIFKLLHPKLDLVILGVGNDDDLQRIDSSAVSFLRENKINIEMLSTPKALQTFNFLNAERRSVACALIPPMHESNIHPEPEHIVRIDSQSQASTDLEARKTLRTLSTQRQILHASESARGSRTPHLLNKPRTEIQSSNDDSSRDNVKK